MKQHHRPLWLGAILAVFTPAACLFAGSLWSHPHGASTTDLLGTAIMIVVVSVPVAFTAFATLGLPFVLWLRSRHALTALPVCGGSAIIGALTFAAVVWFVNFFNPVAGPRQLLIGASLGVASGIVFCAGAGIRIRPSGRAKPCAT
ncbi:MAG: hypothetical protein ACYCZA_11755 [Thiobacillus sp.]